MDEIHERNEMCDFLMTYIRRILPKNKKIKVILMSATLNSDKFSKYFNDCIAINIPGYTFPVQEYYLEDILEKISFKFSEPSKSNEDNYLRHMEFIKSYVKKLQRTKIYSEFVCSELMKPASEEMNLQLVMNVISFICTSVC